MANRCSNRRWFTRDMVRLSGNSGVNPARGGTLLATRVSGWDANSFVALEPPNGGGTSCISEVSPPSGASGIFCGPHHPGLNTLGYCLTPLAGLKFRIDAAVHSLPIRLVNPG